MTDHDVDGVEYVPVCDQCWQAVQLTEADDGTFEHVPQKVPTSIEELNTGYHERARRAWLARFGQAEFSAVWDPEKGVMAFQDEFYNGKLDLLGPLPTVEQHGDDLYMVDYDGYSIVIQPGGSFSYGIQG